MGQNLPDFLFKNSVVSIRVYNFGADPKDPDLVFSELLHGNKEY